MAQVAALVITASSNNTQQDIDNALDAAAIDPLDFLDAITIAEEDVNQGSKIVILYRAD